MTRKIGRNEKCPCGSGKKYKRCCLENGRLKDVDLNYFPLNSQAELANGESCNTDKKLLKKIIPIFNEYAFFDLARAVFCVNAWRGNRPESTFCLTLNQALFDCQKSGNKEIGTYADFTIFFYKIKKHYTHTILVDENVPDFGEVKISYDGSYYPVFLGNGFNRVYSIMQLVEPIARITGRTAEVENVLCYVKDMVYFLKPANPHDKDNSYGELYTPSAEFFSKCCEYYQPLEKITLKVGLLELLITSATNIETAHFIESDELLFPLFNPSIIVDMYHSLEQSLGNCQRKELAISSVYRAILNNFCEDPSKQNVFLPVAVVEQENSIKFLNDKQNAILLMGSKSALFIVDESDFKPMQLKHYIEQIRKMHDSNNLRFFNSKSETLNVMIHVPVDLELLIVAFDDLIRLDEGIKFIAHDEGYRYLLSDVVYILHSAKSIEEICEFVKFDLSNKTMFTTSFFDGKAVIFETWRDMDKEISQGAVSISSIMTEVNLPEWKMFERYKKLEEFFPFDNPGKMFNFADKWIIEEKHSTDFFHFVSNKAAIAIGGRIRRVGQYHLFILFSRGVINKEDFSRSGIKRFKLIEDMVSRGFEVYDELLQKAGFYDNINKKFTYMSTNYAEEVLQKYNCVTEGDYVRGGVYKYDNHLHAGFCVYMDKLFADLENTTTREVECRFFIEILQIASDYFSFEFTKAEIEKDFHKQKATAIKSIPIEHYFSENNHCSWPDQEIFVKVDKDVAIIACEENIKEGEYQKTVARDIIRKLQTKMVKLFEEKIKGFNRENIHKRLLSKLAYYTFEKKQSEVSYYLGNQNLEKEIKNRTRCIAATSIEDTKARKANLRYLIESNIFLKRIAVAIATEDDLDYLIAFACYLVELQGCADVAHWQNEDIKIRVESDYRIFNLSQHHTIEQSMRKLDNKNWFPDDDSWDSKELLDALSKDIGVDFISVMSWLHYLSFEFTYAFKNEAAPDVFCIKKDALISDFESVQIDKTNDTEDYKKAMEYLIVRSNLLKTTIKESGEFISHQYLPIWERRNRINRFDVQPIVQFGDEIIFSPVVCYELLCEWVGGLSKLYPPYEYGLINLCEKMSLIQSNYEKQLEYAVESLCNNGVRIVKRSFTFIGQPSLGDYDVICIDQTTKTVLNIECKYLGYIGSLMEYYNYHQRFFTDKNNYKVKFEKRIKFLRNNLNLFLSEFGINEVSDYSIKSYMVTNKVFLSLVQLSEFELITFNELINELDNS